MEEYSVQHCSVTSCETNSNCFHLHFCSSDFEVFAIAISRLRFVSLYSRCVFSLESKYKNGYLNFQLTNER